MDDLLTLLDEAINKKRMEQRESTMSRVLKTIQNSKRSKGAVAEIVSHVLNERGVLIHFAASDTIGVVLETEDKKLIVQKINEEMQSWDLSEDDFMNAFKWNVKNIKDRLKLLTSDEKASSYQFISEDEKKEVYEVLFEIALFTIKKSLGILEEGDGVKLYDNIIWIHKNKFTHNTLIERFISEDFIKRTAEKELDEIKDLISYCFSQNILNLEETLHNKSMTYDEIKEYFYLFTEDGINWVHYEFRNKIADLVRKSLENVDERSLDDLLKTKEEFVEFLKKTS